MTPLHLAASRVRLDTIACLARLGADPDARCQNGWTPLDWALGNLDTTTDKLRQLPGRAGPG